MTCDQCYNKEWESVDEVYGGGVFKCTHCGHYQDDGEYDVSVPKPKGALEE